jgi:hypothetical protein
MGLDIKKETREGILLWADQFENDHYTLELYGKKFTVDLPRKTVEAILDISILLVDRVLASKDVLHTAEYEEVERRIRLKYPKDSEWSLHTVLDIICNDHLFGPYKDIEPMIRKLMPRGYPIDSAAYLLMVRPELYKLIYAIIRNVDIVEDNYASMVYTFFVCTLAKGWGEGNGWKKNADGSWEWKRE